ncbi:Coat F domain-containing protein [Anaerobranca californiensis DSM 14826]|uniref:Coat F domain-containing protein n=1 Tax=Anaerobranca californiensis DSM 14826 TaxID=1120989 RepID=A0A1M6P5J2_9FIRM|nr:spore coat protein [Anaerobranca californiensis]SHK03239.1 Coat F domain-containing protein [Anaerobranca californiensis DSM 14826]
MANYPNITAKDILHDCLSCEKSLTGLYNTALNEVNNQQLRQDLLSCLNECHTLQNTIYNVMEQRNMYQAKPAQPQEIAQAQQKFTNNK